MLEREGAFIRQNSDRLIHPLRRQGKRLIQVMALLVQDCEFVRGTRSDGQISASTLTIERFLGVDPSALTSADLRDLASNLERLARQGRLRADNFGHCAKLVAAHKNSQSSIPAEICRTLDRVEWFIKLSLDAFAGRSSSQTPQAKPNMDLPMTVVTEASLEEETDSASPTRKQSRITSSDLDRISERKKPTKPFTMLASVVASICQRQQKEKSHKLGPQTKECSILELSNLGGDGDGKPGDTPEGWRQAVERNLNSRIKITRCIFSSGMGRRNRGSERYCLSC